MSGASATNFTFVTIIDGHPADSSEISNAIDTTRQDNLNRTFQIRTRQKIKEMKSILS